MAPKATPKVLSPKPRRFYVTRELLPELPRLKAKPLREPPPKTLSEEPLPKTTHGLVRCFDHQVYRYCWTDISIPPVVSSVVSSAAQDGQSQSCGSSEPRSPLGVLHISHGNCESGERYENLARFLNGQGIVVYSNDHLGHGRTSTAESLARGQTEFDFAQIPKDLRHLCEMAMRENRCVERKIPFFLMGHSVGSVIAQLAVCDDTEESLSLAKSLSGLILTGPVARGSKAIGIVLRALFSSLLLVRGKHYQSEWLERKICFDEWSNRFDNGSELEGGDGGNHNRGSVGVGDKYRWISRDPEALRIYGEKYGHSLSVSYWKSFFSILGNMGAKMFSGLRGKRVFVMQGSEDPLGKSAVGGGGRHAVFYQLLKELKGADVKIIMYGGARHELVNETNKEEVFRDILAWMRDVIDFPFPHQNSKL